MTRAEIEALFGQRARVARADGALLVGRIEAESVARFALTSGTLRRLIRYDHVSAIQAVGDAVPDSD